uniref:Alpha amylase n=1 Tax=Trepomonas sp. PC1 TaxID=1076344 RepID=A0A146K2Y7_9EUKA|eukprot:JAP91243.1 Alpha amylase [Trepomonas sp. PC1]
MRLQYLKDLGIGAVWISPFFKSPQNDCGYDVSDYRQVDELFGTNEDFDELLAKAHELDIKIIIDLVLNHTSEEHEWFKEARKSRDNPKHDWYLWSPGKQPPNNWLSCFTRESAWWYNEATDECYMGQFTKEQPEVNWRNPELRREMLSVLRFWLDKGVDGFRLDVANAYFKDAQLRSNPQEITHPSFYMMDHIHDKNQPEVEEVFMEMRRMCNEYPGDRALIGEIMDERPDISARFQGKNDMLNISFNFNFLWQKYSADAFRQAAVKHYQAIEKYSHENQPSFTLSNHDQPRAASRYGPDQSVIKLIAVMLLTLKGTPTVYYGEEIGMTNVPVPKQQRSDPMSFAKFPLCLGYRDPERTPMQWSAELNGGFTTGQPWLPMGDYKKVNVEAQLSSASILQFYKDLIQMRQKMPSLHLGSIQIDFDREDVFSYVRQFENERVHVYLNFGEEVELKHVGKEVLMQNGFDGQKLMKNGFLVVKE